MVEVGSKIFYPIVLISFLIGGYFLVNSVSGITGLSIFEPENKETINSPYFITGILIVIATFGFIFAIRFLKKESGSAQT
jgi:hypothetical protein|tara:strand:+ start:1996 stop:2235 length:240 start_codon:yes stop_codon:yes gene_type:complete